jgi:ATP-dependent DNA helicase DinG
MAAASASLHDFFGRGGQLQRVHPGFELRPGQIEMARAVAAALAEHRHLLVEAGTGTGKTLAYLLPVLASGRRVLISTGTRNLQEQLVAKDAPLLEAALGRPVNVVSVKGRQNYACKQKIRDLEAQPMLLDLDELDRYRRIRTWVGETAAGDQSELDFLPDSDPLWTRLNARRETCTGQKCPLYNECFLTALHQRAAEAELVVVNHHLFFADLALKRSELPGVLPPYEAVVFDEAHELETVAGQYFGVSLSSHQIEELARDTAATLRLLGRTTAELEQRAEAVRTAGQALLLKAGVKEGRVAFTQRREFLDEHAATYDRFMNALAYLGSGLEALEDKPEEIHTLIRRLADARRRLAYLLESEEEGVVYWIERRGRGVYLQAAPIEVASLLRDMLFSQTDTAILTSATLTVNGGFDYVRERLGLEHARELIVASPFDYPRQSLLYLPRHLPPPNAPGFAAAAVEEIAALLEASGGRAFVLCTSYAQMRLFHQQLTGRLEFPLLVQGSAPRHLLLERFRDTPRAVLFATSSFWQGVDVQGEQLSCVIVDRLPFASPGDPLIAARIAVLRQAGRNAFGEFQIPEAVLALKQGFGRLIRSSRDRGVLALLDARILTQGYGREFLRSLPDYGCTTAIEDVQAFFHATVPPAPAFLAGATFGRDGEAPTMAAATAPATPSAGKTGAARRRPGSPPPG